MKKEPGEEHTNLRKFLTATYCSCAKRCFGQNLKKIGDGHSYKIDHGGSPLGSNHLWNPSSNPDTIPNTKSLNQVEDDLEKVTHKVYFDVQIDGKLTGCNVAFSRHRNFFISMKVGFRVQYYYYLETLTKSKLYLILDFINGGHLFFHLYRKKMFIEDQARFYTAEIVSTVSHLHNCGIMHRDLKPENILINVDGHIVLTDFGLAKEMDESDRSNSMCGTTEYMASEILLSKGHDKNADWWSVGILLYEMLTGQRLRCQERVGIMIYWNIDQLLSKEEEEYDLRSCRRTKNQSKCLNLGSYNYLGFSAADEYCTPRVIDLLKTFSASTCSSRVDGGIASVCDWCLSRLNSCPLKFIRNYETSYGSRGTSL